LKRFFLALLVLIGLAFFGCENGSTDIDTQPIAGDVTEYSAGGVKFKMMAAPGGITFPVGTDDSGEATVENAFLIAETETTWELWDTVRTWAIMDGGYQIEEGRMGYLGYDTGGNTYTPNNQHPVSEIGWYNSVVWCNALTEMVNAETGSALIPVYRSSDGKVIRNSGDTVALYSLCLKPHAGSGFRLTDNMEWELAARWRGDDNTNTVAGYSDPYFTKGDSASGAEDSWLNYDETQRYAVNDQDSTAPVKSKLPNALGLYDMSGNMAEYCDGQNDWNTPNVPVIRGGRWGQNLDGVQVGRQKTDMSFSPKGPSMGFRITKFY
jgi:hypothetical protein